MRADPEWFDGRGGRSRTAAMSRRRERSRAWKAVVRAGGWTGPEARNRAAIERIHDAPL
ncbi:hypothetical protein [Nocardia abscessus]|uniref:hypothetical protein n=1 Tax=Nocardia abscessus TaxID=120957 RepID=UPI0024570E30|nr:hypothetical protein [Nocardia abscessus]